MVLNHETLKIFNHEMHERHETEVSVKVSLMGDTGCNPVLPEATRGCGARILLWLSEPQLIEALLCRDRFF